MWHCPCLSVYWSILDTNFLHSLLAHADFTLEKLFMQIYWIILHTQWIKNMAENQSKDKFRSCFVCKVDRNFNAFSYHLCLACCTLFTFSICIPEYHVETILLQCQYTISLPMPILMFESFCLISNSHQLIWQMYNANIELDFWPFESRFVDYIMNNIAPDVWWISSSRLHWYRNMEFIAASFF